MLNGIIYQHGFDGNVADFGGFLAIHRSWGYTKNRVVKRRGGRIMTIYDIANMAGVSPSTVSRALNGKPGVSLKNRERIGRVLQENNYFRDENVRGLLLQTANVVGILTDDLRSDHQNEGVAFCQNELLTNGYQCFFKYIGDAPDSIERSIAELSARRVSGVLLVGNAFKNHERVKVAIEKWLPDIPVVLVYQSSRIDLPNVYCVGANEKKGFHFCVQKMAERGRKHLALVVDQNRAGESAICEYFESSVKDYSDMQGIVYTGVERSVSGGEEIAEKILHEHPEVDGIICAKDRIAIGIIYGLQKRGRRIPEDISVLGEDNSDLCDVCRPMLTSLDTMVRVSVLMSTRILMDVMQGETQTHKVVLDMELIERDSL